MQSFKWFVALVSLVMGLSVGFVTGLAIKDRAMFSFGYRQGMRDSIYPPPPDNKEQVDDNTRRIEELEK